MKACGFVAPLILHLGTLWS